MLRFLRRSRPKAQPLKAARRSKRKIGLFICACYYRGWSALNSVGRTLVADYERYSDGTATWEAVERAYWASIHRSYDEIRKAEDEKKGRISFVSFTNWAPPSEHFADPAELAQRLAKHAANGKNEVAVVAEQQAQCQLLRDIFQPFCPVFLDPSWLTPTALSLAHSVYEDSTFDHLPILGDVLEDAGCTDRAILDHCRGPGPHVRGCWAVDVLLGKA
jgi:hypothetical protein